MPILYPPSFPLFGKPSLRLVASFILPVGIQGFQMPWLFNQSVYCYSKAIGQSLYVDTRLSILGRQSISLIRIESLAVALHFPLNSPVSL